MPQRQLSDFLPLAFDKTVSSGLGYYQQPIAKLEVPLPVDSWQLIAPNNQAASLTAREYYFLRCLFEQPGELVNKTYLAEKVIGLGVYSAHEKLNKVITLLKKKIVHQLAIPLPIKTVHTLGYAFHADVALVD
jgi:DNA-binding response OmpR family regulator